MDKTKQKSMERRIILMPILFYRIYRMPDVQMKW